MVEVRLYGPQCEAEWNEFVARSKNGTFLFDRRYMDYHSDRFADSSLMVYRDGRLFALFPANREGDVLCSHRGLTYGGLVTGPSATASAVVEAFEAVNAYLRGEGLRRVVYKAVPWIYHRVPAEEDQNVGAYHLENMPTQGLVVDVEFFLPHQELRGQQQGQGDDTAVPKAEGHIPPVGAVPDADDKVDDESGQGGGQNLPQLSLDVLPGEPAQPAEGFGQGEGIEQVIPHPGSQGDVPPAPEVGEGGGEDGAAEVFRRPRRLRTVIPIGRNAHRPHRIFFFSKIAHAPIISFFEKISRRFLTFNANGMMDTRFRRLRFSLFSGACPCGAPGFPLQFAASRAFTEAKLPLCPAPFFRRQLISAPIPRAFESVRPFFGSAAVMTSSRLIRKTNKTQ